MTKIGSGEWRRMVKYRVEHRSSANGRARNRKQLWFYGRRQYLISTSFEASVVAQENPYIQLRVGKQRISRSVTFSIEKRRIYAREREYSEQHAADRPASAVVDEPGSPARAESSRISLNRSTSASLSPVSQYRLTRRASSRPR